MNVETYKILWDFQHDFDQIEDETKMINIFNDIKLTNFYENKQLWNGCFGSMSIIRHDYLISINNKYNISKLLECVLNRYNRKSFERVIACLLQIDRINETLFGNIFDYTPWGINFQDKDNYKYLPITKIWTGR